LTLILSALTLITLPSITGRRIDNGADSVGLNGRNMAPSGQYAVMF